MNGTSSAGQERATPPVIPAQQAENQFSRWWDDMLWHRVLRAPALGLRPGRLGLAFFFSIFLFLLLSVGRAIDARLIPGGAPMPWDDSARADWFALQMWHLFVALPGAWLQGWPITTLIMGPILVVLGAVLLGAISRITAEEFAMGRQMPWHEGLAFSARLWRSTVGAYIGPLVLIWLIALLLAVSGWLLLNWPVLNIIAGLLYGVFLMGALVAIVVGIAYLLGEAMLIPAVVCEGADAIDAVQRSYAYVLARPLRLLAYLLLGMIGVIVIVGVLAAIVSWALGFALQATGAWARPQAWSTLWWASFSEPPPASTVEGPPPDPQGTFAAAAAFIQIWVLVPILLVVASFFSTSMAVATVIYLVMRRVCDGQDVGELWVPGAVEEAMAQVMRSRSEAVKAYRTGTDEPDALGADSSPPS